MSAPPYLVLFDVYYLMLLGVVLIQGWGDEMRIGYSLLFLAIAYMGVYAGLIGPGVAQ